MFGTSIVSLYLNTTDNNFSLSKHSAQIHKPFLFHC